jgi:hypothetical protein
MSSLVLGLAATSAGVASQETGPQAVIAFVYHGSDFRNYYLDPPYWSFQPGGFWNPKKGDWLYKNHRRVFIDIKVKGVASGEPDRTAQNRRIDGSVRKSCRGSSGCSAGN